MKMQNITENIKMKKTLFLSAAIFLLSILSCNTTEPPQQNKSNLDLTLADTSCTEAWLELKTTNISLPANVTIKQDDSLIQTISLTSADTILYVDSLLPNTNYKYQASSIEHQASSNLLNVTTMDTTSHNFNFQTWTFGGQAGSCTLYDVAIINENDIWADGGRVYHFNGSVWEDLSEKYPIFINNIEYLSLWGTSSSDMYFGNYWGKIIYWDGNNASVVGDFPNTRIGDLYGLNHNFIIGVGNTGVVPSTIVKFDGAEWNIFEGIDFTGHILASTYIVNKDEYYIGGAISYRYFSGEWNTIPGNMYRIRGNQETGEIVGVGPGNTLVHFNGVDWYDFKDEISQEYNALYGVFLTGNKIFAVGFNTIPVAKIFIGTRE
jgi:hypothetical protein